MINYVLSFQRNDNESQSYIFDSYLLAFEYFAELLMRANSHYIIREGTFGKGIYYNNDCVFAYGNDIGKDLENFSQFSIVPEDEYYEESDGGENYEDDENYEDNEDNEDNEERV